MTYNKKPPVRNSKAGVGTPGQFLVDSVRPGRGEACSGGVSLSSSDPPALGGCGHRQPAWAGTTAPVSGFKSFKSSIKRLLRHQMALKNQYFDDLSAKESETYGSNCPQIIQTLKKNVLVFSKPQIFEKQIETFSSSQTEAQRGQLGVQRR